MFSLQHNCKRMHIFCICLHVYLHMHTHCVKLEMHLCGYHPVCVFSMCETVLMWDIMHWHIMTDPLKTWVCALIQYNTLTVRYFQALWPNLAKKIWKRSRDPEVCWYLILWIHSWFYLSDTKVWGTACYIKWTVHSVYLKSHFIFSYMQTSPIPWHVLKADWRINVRNHISPDIVQSCPYTSKSSSSSVQFIGQWPQTSRCTTAMYRVEN